MKNPSPIVVLTEVNREFECPTTLSDTAQRLINFRLLDDNEGVWVRCDKCKTWRYAPEEKDPAQLVNRNFHCKDVKKVCNVGADDESDQGFYETRFCAGSLVWAKRPDGAKEKDWLWWPSIVEDSLDDVSQYFLLDAKTDRLIAYHVTYLDAHRTGGWIRADLIKPFKRFSKNVNKHSKSLRGEKRRLLDEAARRASNAARLGVVPRLEKYSYIAHLARLHGVLKGSSLPADAILNNTDKSPSLSGGSSLKNMARRSKPFTVKRKRSSREAEALRQSEATIPSRTKKSKTRHLEEAANEGLNATEESPNNLLEEAALVANVKEIPTNAGSVDVDSGYQEDSLPEGAPSAGEQRTKAKAKKTAKRTPSKKRMDSASESRELSAFTGEEELSAVQPDSKRQQQKPKKSLKPKDKRTFSDSGVESSLVRKVKNRKLSEELQTAPVDLEALKTPQRKEKNTSVGSASPVSPNSFDVGDFFLEDYDVSGSVPQSPKADKTLIDQERESQRQKTPTGAKGLQSSIVKRDSVKTGSKPHVSPKPFYKNQVRARSDSIESSARKSNKRHDATPKSFTQPIRRQSPNSATNRRDPLRQNASQSFHVSQLTASQDRRKFAPPTREKAQEFSYSLDEFQRDLEMGVI